MKIEIIVRSEQFVHTAEVKTIQSLLEWQGIKNEVVVDIKRNSILSRGQSCPVCLVSPQDVTLLGFHRLVEWISKEGLWRC